MSSFTGRLRFADFELDSASGELRRGQTLVKLQLQPLRVLAVLAGRPGELITREEIRAEIWSGDTRVEFDQGLNYCIRRIRAALGDDARAPRFVETLPRRGYRFIAPVERAAAATNIEHKVMLVVLPITELSADPDDEYFSDGLTDEMITALGCLDPEQLGVIARSSAMKYKRTTKGIDQIGHELGVHYALEGSVRRGGERLRISSQLVQVSDQTNLWAGSYDTDLGDILSVQREISHAIAEEIRLKLLSVGRSDERRRVDPSAYELYLKGRYLWHRRTVPDVWKSVRCFEQAVQHDPGLAAAHSGLADAYLTLLDYNELHASEALAPARTAVVQALHLDERLAEAHSSLAHAALHAFDWDEAERGFRRAIELNPSYAMAHFYYANYLTAMGRFDEAIAEARRSSILDPVAALVELNAAFVHYHAGHYERAIESCHRALAIDADAWPAHYDLGRIFVQQGDHRRAIEELDQALQLSGNSQRSLVALGHACAVAGERARAETILNQLQQQPAGRHPPAYGVALLLLTLGEHDNGIRWLQQAYEQKDAGMVFLKVDPRLTEFGSDPRFQSLLKRMDLTA